MPRTLDTLGLTTAVTWLAARAQPSAWWKVPAQHLRHEGQAAADGPPQRVSRVKLTMLTSTQSKTSNLPTFTAVC